MSNRVVLGVLVGIVALASGCAGAPTPRTADGSITGESVESLLAKSSTDGATPSVAVATEQVPFGTSEVEVAIRGPVRERTQQSVAVSVPLQASFLSKRERLRAAAAPVESTW
jgi:hypothetical protein